MNHITKRKREREKEYYTPGKTEQFIDNLMKRNYFFQNIYFSSLARLESYS